MSIQLPDPSSGLQNTIKIISIAAVILAIVASGGALVWMLNDAKSQLTADAVLITALQSQNKIWEQDAERANQALKTLKDETQKRMDDAAAAIAAAEKESSEYAQAAARITAEKPIGSDCAATKALFDTYFEGAAP